MAVSIETASNKALLHVTTRTDMGLIHEHWYRAG